MLSSTTSSAVYQASGGEGDTVFPIPFPFLEAAHIHAHLRGPDGTGGRTLAHGLDYAVHRLGAGGEVVLLGEPLAAGTELVVRRLLPLTQEILFHNQGPNSPSATEEALDKLTMIAQQLRDDAAAAAERREREREQEEEPPAAPPPAAAEPPELALRVEAVEDAAAELSATAAGLTAGLADANVNLAAVLSDLAAVQEALAGLGALASEEDAPPGGGAYLRQAGGWVAYVDSGAGDGGGEPGEGEPAPPPAPPSVPAAAAPAYPGEIRLLPFRPGELPPGWAVCDGASFSRDTPEFAAVALLPANFVADWGISRNALRATLPDLQGGAFRSAGAGESPGSAGTGTGGGAGMAWAMTPAMYLGAS